MMGSALDPIFMTDSPVGLSHEHYSEAVQEAVSVFKMTYAAWNKLYRKDMKENMLRLDSLQACWNALVLARIAETGVAFYLDEKQYRQAIENMNKTQES